MSGIVTWLSGGLAAAIMLGIAGLHVYWAFGGQAGAAAAIPEVAGKPAFAPTPLMTLGVAGVLIAAAILVLGAAGVFGGDAPGDLFTVGTGFVIGAFLLRAMGDFNRFGFFKKVTGTRFAELDTRLYSPLCLGLAALSAGALV